MSLWERYLHLIIFIAWGGASLYLGVRIATSGSEEARLARQRGSDMVKRRKLDFERNELRSEMEWAARLEFIDGEVRRLRLPIARPVMAGDTSVAAFGRPRIRRVP